VRVHSGKYAGSCAPPRAPLRAGRYQRGRFGKVAIPQHDRAWAQLVARQTLPRVHVTQVQFPDLLGDRVIGHVPAVIRALRSWPTDLRAITDDQLPAPRGPGGAGWRATVCQESLTHLGRRPKRWRTASSLIALPLPVQTPAISRPDRSAML